MVFDLSILFFPPRNIRFKIIPKINSSLKLCTDLTTTTQMAFWGIYLKPNEPHTLLYVADAVPKRLRITQATLGDATRNSPARSIVRCWVGDKTAIAICSLSVKEMPCCQLDLEFEEFHTVVFSVMGPRGVYLSGYLIAPSSTAHHHTIGLEEQEKATMENSGCIDHDLQEDQLESNETLRESREHCDKNMKDGKRLLKCCRKKIREGKINTTVDQKMGKDGKQDYIFGSHEKYLNRLQLCTSDEDKEKIVALKWHTVFGRFLGEKRVGANEKMKRRNRKRKRKLKLRITEANCSPDAYKRSHAKAKERKKKHEKSNGNVEDDFCGKAKSKDQERKISKIVFS